ncbi:MAG: hypothetical protein IPN67_10870 [Bacteroidales bacterium]|nr:hypothetical protein [Bacteroidales bacterium]
MNINFFLQGIKNVIINPLKLWEKVESENIKAGTIRNSFFIPFSLLVALSAFIGSLLFTNPELSPAYSVLFSIKCLVVIFIAVYATAYLLGEITYPLDLGRDFNISFSLVVFSVTPFLLCQILSRLFESLLFVNIIGFYGLYIFWTGVEKRLTPPQYKKMPLMIAAFITFAGIYIAADLLLNMITDRFYFAFFA